ncbi:MAG: hypothetical protein LQ350_004060 [Teloschistes chrysophthalmus]|nr:MAG: hypothetical protein LQ350_004060 [Niorma chrysophthalma]
MEFATSQSALSIPSMITTLDPLKKTSSSLDNILTALTVGLAFLSLPSIGALVPATTSLLGTILVTSLQQAPPVAQAIFKTPDDSPDQLIQFGELASELSTLNTRVGEMLDRGLAVIMHDVTAFAAFATPSGAFSGPEILSLPKETSRLDLALKTHLVAAAMAANEWTVFIGPPDDPITNTWFNSTLASNAEKFVCNVANPEQGICDTIDSRGVIPLCQPEDWGSYTSPYTHRAYYPSQGGSRNDPPSARLLHDIVDNGWGTLDAIMDGAYNCTIQGGGGGGVSLRWKEGGGGIEFGCLAGKVKVVNGCEEIKEQGWKEGCNFFFERHKKPPIVNAYGNVGCNS